MRSCLGESLCHELNSSSSLALHLPPRASSIAPGPFSSTTSFMSRQLTRILPYTSSSTWICGSCLRNTARSIENLKHRPKVHAFVRYLQTETSTVPFRKQLKDEARSRRTSRSGDTKGLRQNVVPRLDNWELTVGVEIHAQLNTEHKLFSSKYIRRILPCFFFSNTDCANSCTHLNK